MVNNNVSETTLLFDQTSVKDMPEEDWLKYYEDSTNKGAIYLYNGITRYTPIVYGTATRRLTVQNGTWDIGMAAVIPSCEVKPVMLDKPTFERLMRAHGVPEELLQKFFEEEWTKEDWLNF